MTISIRKALQADLPAINDIYNEAIINTVATFDTDPKSPEYRTEWFSQHGDTHPVLVATEGDVLLGWASLSRWSDRCAYDSTAELSVYVDAAWRGKGVGKALMISIVDAGKQAGLHTLISRITEGNAASIHLHEKLDFSHIGVMKEVGRKFGKLLDVYMMQLIFK